MKNMNPRYVFGFHDPNGLGLWFTSDCYDKISGGVNFVYRGNNPTKKHINVCGSHGQTFIDYMKLFDIKIRLAS